MSTSSLIKTPFGDYLVRGVGRFAIAGDLKAEVSRAVQTHTAERGLPPDAVVWDDAVLDFRSFNLTLGLLRVAVPVSDSWLAERIDHQARCAVHVAPGAMAPTENEALLQQAPRQSPNVAYVEGLLRFVGWPEAAPLTSKSPAAPAKVAQSISVIINYRDKADATIACLERIAAQKRTALLELVAIDNQSRPGERLLVDRKLQTLFGLHNNAIVQHVSYDFPFNHSYQCNYGATLSSGEVLVMMSNDCKLLSENALQVLANWALEPEVGGAGPRIIADTGAVVCSGIAIADRAKRGNETSLRIFESEADYLSREVRSSCGVTFACAAISRQVWFSRGGADSIEFPIDYNDADFSLRCSRAQLRHIYVGDVDVQHQPGLSDLRSRDQSIAIHDKLVLRHDLKAFAQNNPYAATIGKLPTFDLEAANDICDLIRLYRLAHAARGLEVAFARDLAFLRSFESLVSTSASGRSLRTAADLAELFEKIRGVCREYVRIAPRGDIPQRYRSAFDRSSEALRQLSLAASALQPEDSAQIARGEINPNDPDQQGEYHSFSDLHFDSAETRLLVFADSMGPTLQSILIQGLGHARARGDVALRILTEADCERLLEKEGSSGRLAFLEKLFSFLRPTSCIFSRFADWDACKNIERVLRDSNSNVARILILEDDLLNLPPTLGADHYRQVRAAKKFYALSSLVEWSDLILTSSLELKRKLFDEFGTPTVSLGVASGARLGSVRLRHGVRKIGYCASETGVANLALVAPALREIKKNHPTISIEIVGSIAKAPEAIALQDVAQLDPNVNPEYLAFRQSLGEREWTLGLAPLADTPFNRTKSPIKWLEYTDAGAVTLCSNVEAYRELGIRGAAILVNASEWYGTLSSLVAHPERLHGFLSASRRLVEDEYSWQALENKVLSAITRAQRSRLASKAL